MLRTRILSAAVFAPALLGVVYVGGFWLHGVCAVLALLAFWELSRMFGIAERPFEALVGYLEHLRDFDSHLAISTMLSPFMTVSLLSFLAVLKLYL